MRPQQQATQNLPCSAPNRRAPARAGSQWSARNARGSRQRRRHASFGRVSWYSAPPRDHASRQVAPRLVPGEESEVERADAFDEHVAQQARYEPGDQIAGREGGGGRQARCPTTVRGHHRRDCGRIIAAIIRAQVAANEPSPPRSLPGPASIPAMRRWVSAHAMRPVRAAARPRRSARDRQAAGWGGARWRSCRFPVLVVAAEPVLGPLPLQPRPDPRLRHPGTRPSGRRAAPPAPASVSGRAGTSCTW